MELTNVNLKKYGDQATLRLEFGADNVHEIVVYRGQSYLSVIANLNRLGEEIRDSMTTLTKST